MIDYILFWLAKIFAEFMFVIGWIFIILLFGLYFEIRDAKRRKRNE